MAKHSGQFKKGQGGRPKGVVNKKTQMWNEIGEYVVNEGAEKFMEILKEKDDKEFLNYFLSILEYFKPKQARTEVTGKDGGPMKVEGMINIIDPD